MRKLLVCFVCGAALIAAQTLPVKRVVLYKNGVGYFEHLGSVRGSESVTVGFTSAQLNDVLKSLTVLDLNGGRITGVSYGSAAPVERQLAEMNLPAGEKASVGTFLDTLRGSKVEFKSGTLSLTGRVLGVESRQSVLNGRAVVTQTVALLTGGGELRSMELSPAVAVRLLEPGLNAKLDRYLDVVSGSHSADERRMVIATAGSGERRLFVSYISEVPVWKSTYRIVLDDKDRDKATVQAWAIVDNTVGEDWNGVELSLVAGAPQSFVQNLSLPYYAKRPVVDLPEYASTSPQTHEGTLTVGQGKVSGIVKDPSGAAVANATVRASASGTLVQQTFTDSSGRFSFQNLPDSTIELDAQAPGFQLSKANVEPGSAGPQEIRLAIGSTAQSVEIIGASSARNSLGSGKMLGRISGSPAAPSGGSGGGSYRPIAPPPPPAATGQELGDLFEYKLDSPITVAKNRSALVPIAQASLDAEKVSLYTGASTKPQRALWFTNTSKLTLDGGTVSVSDGGAFAGEGLLDPIRPGEKRLLSYATDLALNISTKGSSEPERVTHVSINKGIMRQDNEVREKKVYTIRNTDVQPRRVILEHPLRQGYDLRGDVKPVETSATFRRFALSVAPASTGTLTVEEARHTSTEYYLSSITPDEIALFIREHSVDPALRSALDKVVVQKNVLSDLENRKSAREAETQKIFDDQQRLRENIKALRGAPEEKPLLQRYTSQLNSQETRLPQIEKEISILDSNIQSEQTKLDGLIENLSFDISING